MMLDIRFLIERLRSTRWEWTKAVVGHLLRVLGLREVGTDAGGSRRDFSAPSGLTCVVYDQAEGPVRFEFPFTVPTLDGVSRAEMLEQFTRLCRVPVEAVLGWPSLSNPWTVGSSTIAVEPRPGDAADVVALVVSKARSTSS